LLADVRWGWAVREKARAIVEVASSAECFQLTKDLLTPTNTRDNKLGRRLAVLIDPDPAQPAVSEVRLEEEALVISCNQQSQ
jgi:hypothetical protein